MQHHPPAIVDHVDAPVRPLHSNNPPINPGFLTPAQNRPVLTENPPNHVPRQVLKQRALTHARILSCNLPCKRFLSTFLSHAPFSHVLMLTELRRTKQEVLDDFEKFGWILVAYAETEEDAGVFLRAAIAIHATANAEFHNPVKYHTACAATVCVEGVSMRLITAYVPCSTEAATGNAMGRWICEQAMNTTLLTIVTGDYNHNTAPHCESQVRTLPAKDHIGHDATWWRGDGGTINSSLDRVFTLRHDRHQVQVCPPKRNDKISDHAALVVNITPPDATISPIPSMAHLRHGTKLNFEGGTVDDLKRLMDTLVAGEVAPRTRSTKEARLTTAVNNRLKQRSELPEHDLLERTRLNIEIKDIRKKLMNICARTDENPLATARRAYTAPTISPGPLLDFYRSRFQLDSPPVYPPYSAADGQLLTTDSVVQATKALKRKARTADYSADFLRCMSNETAENLRSIYETWLTEGVPMSEAVSWLFMVKKPGRRAALPESYRGVAIMPLLLKGLHATIAVTLRSTIVGWLEREEFQTAVWDRYAIWEIVDRAQEWLSSDADNVVLLADIEAAYDNVDHDVLLEIVRRTLGAKWVGPIARILEAQWVSPAFGQGYAAPIQLHRGLLQGSALSVLLYALYTTVGPDVHPETWKRAVVDDMTFLTTRERLQEDYEALARWSAERRLRLAPKKPHILCRTPFQAQLDVNGAQTAVESARDGSTLGACLHAVKCTECPTTKKKVARVCRLIKHVASIPSTSTRTKASQIRAHALPTLSVHALSKCLQRDGNQQRKLQLAIDACVPRHVPPGSGVRTQLGLRVYNESSLGYNLPNAAEYIEEQAVRGRVARCVRGDDAVVVLKDFHLERLEDTPTPALVWDVRDAISRAEESGKHYELATDGGFWDARHNPPNVGTVGIAVGSEAFGAVIEGMTTSSTHAELVASMVLAIATIDLPYDLTTTPAFCDARNVGARQRAGLGWLEPVHGILCLPTTPPITWAPGHATNEAINAAHKAATAAKRQVTELLDVRGLLAAGGVSHVLVHTPTGTVQTDSAPRFVRAMRQRATNLALMERLATWVPREIMDKKATRNLRGLCHAEDILHAILRRAIGPTRTTATCTVTGCEEKATIEHAMTCTKAGQPHAGEHPYQVLSMKKLLKDYAAADRRAIAHVCHRLIHVLQEPVSSRWARRLLKML
eukprot:TRINITY_DN535_c0_g2_i12.p1 TRINITY_DN535_c0_g2~~TRINITY_DN535_c0_g2_i12.p1  ORF type:complete len:1184 (+),score=-56.90 TRINITY_DN535_c0_g2_i12:1212-4763(+)